MQNKTNTNNTHIKVAAAQMCSKNNPTHNLVLAKKLLIEAHKKQAKLISFPENFLMVSENKFELLKSAQTLNGEWIQEIIYWAKTYKIWVHAGSIPMQIPNSKNKVYNTSFLISPQGKIIASYNKIHLFDADVMGDKAYKESNYFKPGNKIVTAKTPWGNAGLSICYDIRFPELYRAFVHKKPNIIFIPVSFTRVTGKAHWDILTRARAIENQAFVIAAAQTGTHSKKLSTYGHTRIIDPWGEVLDEIKTGTGIAIADINLEKLKTIRENLPALSNRRLKTPKV